MKLLQGTNFQVKVPNGSCQFVASDGTNKIIVSDIETDTDGEYYLVASAETTREWMPTGYTYQIIDENGLIDSGKLIVMPNLLYWGTSLSYWQTVVNQIEQKLAGKALDAAYSVTVDGKSISYMSVDELLKLLSFAKGKLAEEEAEEAGKEPWDKTNRTVGSSITGANWRHL